MPGLSANASTASSGGALTPASEADAARTLGKYELLRLLARGGMGEVHLARLPGELGFEKLLVVKTIRADLAADPRFVELFAAEAKTAVGLRHPNITPIYELGRADDGTLYTAMGWVDGPSLYALGERLRSLGRRLELGAVLFIVREILDGLAHAHSHDRERPPVVHRDINPANVLVDRSGRVQIVDFGIAKPAETEVRGVMGSAGYMAPEQARGGTVDPSADVFSVGCVFYELLTNARAFTGEGVWMSPSLAEIPAQLRPLIERALAFEPEQRFRDAGAFLRAVAPLLAEHAPSFASRELAAILAQLLPDDWAAEASPSSGARTPATKLTGPVQTFATRLEPASRAEPPTRPAPAVAADPGPSERARDDPSSTESTESTEATGPERSRGRVGFAGRLVALVAAVALAAAVGGYLVARTDATPPVERSGALPGQTSTATAGSDPEPEPGPVPEPATVEAEPARGLQLALEVSPDDAVVTLDGRALTGPPFTLVLDGDAPRQLLVHRDGHRDVSIELDPAAPPDSPVAITLAPLELGKLSVLAPNVAWAEVWLDGTKLGTTPLSDKDVVEGRHKLEVRCTPAVCGEARVLLDRHVRIKAGRQNTFSPED
ncbi:serine/threonine-protein kinase [Enhygromyxa salina]|uniref:serine/threonine-protein kinase n=1 Tax=Enhygromyxa salina TaxID=215803 RepID=UPI0015E61D54|nr:serine/threonine-protein kinase [Enhygromyxa salina]